MDGRRKVDSGGFAVGFVDRMILVLAALAGLAGVGLSAWSYHGGGGGAALTSAAAMALAHAPALGLAALCAALNATNRLLTRLAALAFILGLVLFVGSVALPAIARIRLPIANAAPVGGVALMAGWALLALAALLKWRR